MAFSNSIPRTGLPQFHESSSQRSHRDSQSIARQWIKHNDTSGQVSSVMENVKQIQRQLDRLRKRVGTAEDGERIRLLLCDGITGGPPKYYLVTAELDPDQTPTP